MNGPGRGSGFDVADRERLLRRHLHAEDGAGGGRSAVSSVADDSDGDEQRRAGGAEWQQRPGKEADSGGLRSSAARCIGKQSPGLVGLTVLLAVFVVVLVLLVVVLYLAYRTLLLNGGRYDSVLHDGTNCGLPAAGPRSAELSVLNHAALPIAAALTGAVGHGVDKREGPGASVVEVPSAQAPQGPTVDFFVRTWRGDGHWLVFLLRSIVRFVPPSMYRQIIICFSHVELAFFTSYLHSFQSVLRLVLAPVVDQDTAIAGPNNGGYSSQMISKFYAFNHSDAEYFIHMDSDTIFNRPVTLLDFLDEQRRVYVTTVEYATMEQNFVVWQSAAQQLLREPVPKETMTSFPFVYPRALYPTAIALVEAAHGATFVEAARNCTRIIEFTTLGHVLITRFPGQWVEKSVQQRADMVYQSWSWGGFAPEIVAWYECVLQSGRRDECTLQQVQKKDKEG